jgi:hypothetical protein
MIWKRRVRPSAILPAFAAVTALLLGQSMAMHSVFCTDDGAAASSGYRQTRAANTYDGPSEMPFCQIYKNFSFESSLPEAVHVHAPAAMSDGESAHPVMVRLFQKNGFSTIFTLPSLFRIKSSLLL